MGNYYDSFTYFDLPTYYRDSKERHHAFDEHGKHKDSCLLHDVASKLSEICLVDKVDASTVHFSVTDGVAYLKGSAESEAARKFITNAIDSLPGIMSVKQQIEVTPAK